MALDVDQLLHEKAAAPGKGEGIALEAAVSGGAEVGVVDALPVASLLGAESAFERNSAVEAHNGVDAKRCKCGLKRGHGEHCKVLRNL